MKKMHFQIIFKKLKPPKNIGRDFSPKSYLKQNGNETGHLKVLLLFFMDALNR